MRRSDGAWHAGAIQREAAHSAGRRAAAVRRPWKAPAPCDLAQRSLTIRLIPAGGCGLLPKRVPPVVPAPGAPATRASLLPLVFTIRLAVCLYCEAAKPAPGRAGTGSTCERARAVPSTAGLHTGRPCSREAGAACRPLPLPPPAAPLPLLPASSAGGRQQPHAGSCAASRLPGAGIGACQRSLCGRGEDARVDCTPHASCFAHLQHARRRASVGRRLPRSC